jgi:hypothetical protein
VVGTRKATAYEADGQAERLRAQEAANERVAALIAAEDARREELLAEGRKGVARQTREIALFKLLSGHELGLWACEPWGPDPAQDEQMRGVLRGMGCRVAVWRRPEAPAGRVWRVVWGGADPRAEHPATDGTTGGPSANRMLDALRRALAALPLPG